MAFWTQADVDALKAAIASGALEVEYHGPPRRRVVYQSFAAMRSLLAEMRREVEGSVTHRKAIHRKGFRGPGSSRFRSND
jgi:hypothetical protein